jgi:thioredoxin reductase (NADPH)
MAPGGQALVIDVLENYPGIAAGGAAPRSGFEFAQDLSKQAEDFGASLVFDAVSSLTKKDGVFTLDLQSGKTLSAPAAIIASGSKSRKLGVKGEEEFYGRGVSYCATCDGPFFKGKKIFVAGGGDAACDEAQYLSHLTGKVVLVHRRERFRAQKALAERVLANPNIEVRFNTVIQEIRGDKKVSSLLLAKTGEAYEEEADAVFVFAGTVPLNKGAQHSPKVFPDPQGHCSFTFILFMP